MDYDLGNGGVGNFRNAKEGEEQTYKANSKTFHVHARSIEARGA